MTSLLTLSCHDRPGIVGAVGTFLAARQCNILESAQFGDAETGRFMMRVRFERLADAPALAALRREFVETGARFTMDWRLDEADRRQRVLIMVSRQDHCLNDLLYRHSIGALAMEPVAVVSNHDAAAAISRHYEIPFHHLPVTPQTKVRQEAELLDLIERTRAELVVLARYMQILSDELCAALVGRAINIHHSFLPSFKGARPYHQAYERGVKLIGATAHYVTHDLDEGPIIDQQVIPVTHAMSPEELAAAGRDVECRALANAVRYHVERRVFLNGNRTVVFA
jgi:formyltetrahydrofolate deformylase